MLRIGICDDVYDARLVLRSALERVLERRRDQRGSFWSSPLARDCSAGWSSHAGELDLVFLDMEMGELDGMETARRLRAADAGLQLVFVTGYADHVFDGYSVGALGYLMKPPKAGAAGGGAGPGPGGAGTGIWTGPTSAAAATPTTASPLRNILYFVSDRRQVTCVTAGREYTFYGKLDAVAAEVGSGLCPPPPAVSGPGGERWTGWRAARRC